MLVPKTVARLTVAIVLIIPLAAAVASGQTPPPPGTLDQATVEKINNLKRQALEAHKREDQVKEKDLYDQILNIDPNDVLAGQEFKRIEAEIKAKTTRRIDDEINQKTDEAKAKRISDLVASARAKIALVKNGGDPDLLESAESDLDGARNSQPTPQQLKQIEDERESLNRARSYLRTRFWELWGGIGLVVLVALGALIFYFWRRDRTLEVVDGPEMGRRFALKKEQTSLGALADEVDWALPDPMRKVSRHHCDVLRTGRHYFVIDRSTNGTFLNGQLLPRGEPVLLRRGDQIGLGGEVVVRFR
jgi:predicted component of type VI protein secretion system